MEKQDDKKEEQLGAEEDFLDLDLDDLVEEDMEEQGTDSEEEIIELVDLLEKGPGYEDSIDEDFSGLLKEDEAAEEDSLETPRDELSGLEDILQEDKRGPEEPESDLDLDDFSLDGETEEDFALEPPAAEDEEIGRDEHSQPLDESQLAEPPMTEVLDKELPGLEGAVTEEEEDLFKGAEDVDVSDVFVEVDESSEVVAPDQQGAEEQISDIDLENIMEEAEELEFDLEAPAGPEETFEHLMKRAETEKPFELEEAEPIEEIGVPLAVEEPQVAEVAGPPAEPPAQALAGISEEKAEEILKRVVTDVVERAVRETMASVAEKVIREAIDVLKQSLDLPSDEGEPQDKPS
jgi:hypothetical protein